MKPGVSHSTWLPAERSPALPALKASQTHRTAYKSRINPCDTPGNARDRSSRTAPPRLSGFPADHLFRTGHNEYPDTYLCLAYEVKKLTGLDLLEIESIPPEEIELFNNYGKEKLL